MLSTACRLNVCQLLLIADKLARQTFNEFCIREKVFEFPRDGNLRSEDLAMMHGMENSLPGGSISLHNKLSGASLMAV